MPKQRTDQKTEPPLNCRSAFSEDELFRAHALVLDAADARRLAHELAEGSGGPSIGYAWSQTSLILLSFLGPDVRGKVEWVRRNCGCLSAGPTWDVEMEQIQALLRDRRDTDHT